jgi:hypothetical protein
MSSDIRKERFAEFVAQGDTQADAYRKAYPKAKKWKNPTVYNKAVILAKEMAHRIAELREASTSDAIMSAREAKETLTKIARNHIDMREKILDEDGIPIGERDIPNRDRIAAIDRLAKMQGWDAAEKTVTQVEVVEQGERASLVTKLIAAQMRLKEPSQE